MRAAGAAHDADPAALGQGRRRADGRGCWTTGAQDFIVKPFSREGPAGPRSATSMLGEQAPGASSSCRSGCCIRVHAGADLIAVLRGPEPRRRAGQPADVPDLGRTRRASCSSVRCSTSSRSCATRSFRRAATRSTERRPARRQGNAVRFDRGSGAVETLTSTSSTRRSATSTGRSRGSSSSRPT